MYLMQVHEVPPKYKQSRSSNKLRTKALVASKNRRIKQPDGQPAKQTEKHADIPHTQTHERTSAYRARAVSHFQCTTVCNLGKQVL